MRSAPSKDGDTFIPPLLEISEDDFLDVYPTWVQWRATGRRFLPTELRKQPSGVLDQLLYIDSIFDKIVEQVLKRDTDG